MKPRYHSQKRNTFFPDKKYLYHQNQRLQEEIRGSRDLAGQMLTLDKRRDFD
jgi:hypothetical protein